MLRIIVRVSLDTFLSYLTKPFQTLLSETVINSESRTDEPSSNSDLICSVHFLKNALVKGINLFLLAQLQVKHHTGRDSLVLNGIQSRSNCLNSEPWRRQLKTTLLSFSRMHSKSQIINKRKLSRYIIGYVLKGYDIEQNPCVILK